MNIKCTKSGNLVVYETNKNNKQSPVKISECVNIGIDTIQSYLKKWKLKIVPLTASYCKKLIKNDELRINLCGDHMEENLLSVVDEINDGIDDGSIKDPSNFEVDNNIRLTYILTNSQGTLILGIISSIINYDAESVKFTAKTFYDTKIAKGKHVYIEIGCSTQIPQYKNCVAGTNYFIRAFILLKAFELKKIRMLWGQASGTVRGEQAKLRDLHKKRGCKFIEGTDFYECNSIEFLNIFFERIGDESLLKFAIQCDF